jgi:uncharacterized protein (UPF0332 family)
MINSFNNYLKQGKAKRKTPDLEEAKALLKQAQERIIYIKHNKITTTTAKFILEDAYEAIRESAQALMSIKGFKPYSHEATISFIQDHHKEFNKQETNLLNHFRVLRNNSIYRAQPILEQDAIQALELAKQFTKKTQRIILRNTAVASCDAFSS